MAWCPWALYLPGPSWKGNPWPRQGKGAVLHSMEGSYDNAYARLLGPDQVSWHFSIKKDGTTIQHYSTNLQAWHAKAAGNPYYVGIEHEGKAGEPETEEQVRADIHLLEWLDEGLYERGVTLWEHNELTATACPSHRILWDRILAGLYPAPVTIDGIGVVLDDGTDLGNILPALPEGRTVAGVGAHMADGSIQGLWPK